MQPGEGAQQGGFAAAVGPDEGNDAAGLKLQPCTMDHVPVPVTEHQVAGLKPEEFALLNHKLKISLGLPNTYNSWRHVEGACAKGVRDGCR